MVTSMKKTRWPNLTAHLGPGDQRAEPLPHLPPLLPVNQSISEGKRLDPTGGRCVVLTVASAPLRSAVCKNHKEFHECSQRRVPWGWLSCFQSTNSAALAPQDWTVKSPHRNQWSSLNLDDGFKRLLALLGSFRTKPAGVEPGKSPAAANFVCSIKTNLDARRTKKTAFLTEAEKPEAWTPPTSVYSWPQINLTGKYNPPLYHLPGLWTHRDAKVWRQSTANERQVFFFCSVVHGTGRQENSSSMQAAISASPGPASLVLSHTQSDLSRPCEVSQT